MIQSYNFIPDSLQSSQPIVIRLRYKREKCHSQILSFHYRLLECWTFMRMCRYTSLLLQTFENTSLSLYTLRNNGIPLQTLVNLYLPLQIHGHIYLSLQNSCKCLVSFVCCWKYWPLIAKSWKYRPHPHPTTIS